MNQRRKIDLTPKRYDWVRNRTTTLNSIPLIYNVGVQEKYYKAILQLVRRMQDDIKRTLIELYKTKSVRKFYKQQKTLMAQDSKSDIPESNFTLSISTMVTRTLNNLQKKYDSLFKQKYPEIIDSMWKDSLKVSSGALNVSFKKLSGGLTLNPSIIPKGLESISKSVLQENADLIKTIPSKFLKEVQGAVTRSITSGQGLDDLIPELDRYATRNLRHTKNMALDQTRKAYNSINKQRMLSAGLTKYKWIHSGGGREPRPDHVAMNGKTYSFNDNPIIDPRTGERGIPGQAINCRCTMEPVLEFDDGEIL